MLSNKKNISIYYMSSLYRRYFELNPINNINEFSSQNGVNVINFIVPSLDNVLLPTGDLVLQGNLQLDVNSTTPKTKADTVECGIDSVLGLHGAISRVEITSRRGNVMLEQRLSYGLNAKLSRANISNDDLKVGRFNVQHGSGEIVKSSGKFLNRQVLGDEGFPFNINLSTGLLADNLQSLNLGAIGGVEIKITLASTANFLFNTDNSTATANKLDGEAVFKLVNCKLFGRYQYVEPALAARMNGVEFKQMANTLQVVQSSNDTLAFQPQVSSLDKIIYVFQPNSTTKNNLATNNYQTNSLVGQNRYRVSRNGTLFPMDFSVDNQVTVPNLPPPVNKRYIQAGSAEQAYHLILGLNGIYPPIHSLVSGINQTLANYDLSGENAGNEAAVDPTTNDYTNNINCISTSYQYGFSDFATPMNNDLIQIQLESSVKTSDAVVNQAVRDQTQTVNTLMVYNTTLNYANLSVSK
jgi:hypothetical protein